MKRLYDVGYVHDEEVFQQLAKEFKLERIRSKVYAYCEEHEISIVRAKLTELYASKGQNSV